MSIYNSTAAVNPTQRVRSVRTSFRSARQTMIGRVPTVFVATLVLLFVASASARVSNAQGGGGANSPTTPPAASSNIKRILDKSDPLAFLLDSKKSLNLQKSQEDSLKFLRKEMQRMQEVIYKDLDKAAAVKDRGQPLSPTIIFSMTKESEERVKDIQSAYRDRARGMLTERQTVQADSLEVIWKRGLPRTDPLQAKRPPSDD